MKAVIIYLPGNAMGHSGVECCMIASVNGVMRRRLVPL